MNVKRCAWMMAAAAMLVSGASVAQPLPGSPSKADPAKKADPPGKSGTPGKPGDPPGKPGEPGKSGDAPGKAGEPGKSGDAPGKAGDPGKSGDAPGQDPTKAGTTTATPEEKAKERPNRVKKQRDALRTTIMAKLDGQEMHAALKQELRRHAERVARIERIADVAAEAKDEAGAERAKKLLDKENARHDKFLKGFDPKGEAKAGAK
jgi:hypothetical protein